MEPPSTVQHGHTIRRLATSVSIPDARACTITYTAAVQLKPGESFGSLGGNTIVLAGYENNGGTSQNTITGTVQQSKGGMKYNQSTLQIYKYTDGDLGKPAGSATFKVEVSPDATSCRLRPMPTAPAMVRLAKKSPSS